MRETNSNVRPLRAQRRSTHDEEDDDAVAVDGFKPLLPEGQWFEARFDSYSTAIIFATPKVFWEFTIVEPGDWFEHKLFRAFRVRKIIGRPAKHGKFVLAASGEMYATLVRLLDVKQRADRITLRPLKQMLFRIKARTVRTNHKQERIPEHAQYSVVEEIERSE